MGERSERSERHREFGSDIKKSPESDGPAGRRGASHPDVRHPARAPAPARRGSGAGAPAPPRLPGLRLGQESRERPG